MTERVSYRFGRPQARQAQRHAAVEPAGERATRLGVVRDAGVAPEVNRQDRVIVTVYAAPAVLVTLFVTATAVAWWLRG